MVEKCGLKELCQLLKTLDGRLVAGALLSAGWKITNYLAVSLLSLLAIGCCWLLLPLTVQLTT
jgi:hypothetical protein